MVYPGPFPLRIARQDVTTHHLDMLHIPRTWCREDINHEDSHPNQALAEHMKHSIHEIIRTRTHSVTTCKDRLTWQMRVAGPK